MINTISVFNTLSADITSRLRTQLTTAISDESQTRSIVNGVSREFPSDAEINITVQPGGETWKHTLNISSQDVGMRTGWIGEIGGLLYYRRRFTVDLQTRFKAHISQNDANMISHIVLSRTEWALRNKDTDTGNWWFSLAEDSFGEHASRIQVMDSYMVEGGGDKAWRWTGEVRLEFLTEAPGCV